MPVSAGCTVAASDATHACHLVLKRCVLYAMLATNSWEVGALSSHLWFAWCVCVSLCVCVSRSVCVCVWCGVCEQSVKES